MELMKRVNGVLLVVTLIALSIINHNVTDRLEIALEEKANAEDLLFKEREYLHEVEKLKEDVEQEIDKLRGEVDRLIKENGDLKELTNKKVIEELTKLVTLSSRPNDGMLSVSGATEESINKALESSDLEGLGKYYIQAEEEYGINAKFLASISILESGWGKSKIAREKNNIFGFQAYDSNTSKARTFSSKGESILHVGEYVANNYLTKGGKHYSGTSIESVNEKYCTSKDWSGKVRSLMKKM